MPIMTQQYLTAIYIMYTYWLGNRGGKCPPCPPSSAAYGVCKVVGYYMQLFSKQTIPEIFLFLAKCVSNE